MSMETPEEKANREAEEQAQRDFEAARKRIKAKRKAEAETARVDEAIAEKLIKAQAETVAPGTATTYATRQEQLKEAMEKAAIFKVLSGRPGVADGNPLYELLSESLRDIFVGVTTKIKDFLSGNLHKEHVELELYQFMALSAHDLRNTIGAEDFHKEFKSPSKLKVEESDRDIKSRHIDKVMVDSKTMPKEVIEFSKDLLNVASRKSQEEFRALVEKYFGVKVKSSHSFTLETFALTDHPGAEDDGITRDSAKWCQYVIGLCDDIAQNLEAVA